MEGRRRDVAGAGGGGGGDDESDGSSGVELSLRLRTGDSTPAAAEEAEAAAARRKMTIFYNGRVCAVDVTEIQAREIISMANQEILADQQLRGDDQHPQDRRSSNATARCCGQVRLPAALSPAGGAPRQGLAAPVMDQAAAGLSMKRSLQRFLQKRQARTAAAVAPPYAGGGRQAQALRH